MSETEFANYISENHSDENVLINIYFHKKYIFVNQIRVERGKYWQSS